MDSEDHNGHLSFSVSYTYFEHFMIVSITLVAVWLLPLEFCSLLRY